MEHFVRDGQRTENTEIKLTIWGIKRVHRKSLFHLPFVYKIQSEYKPTYTKIQYKVNKEILINNINYIFITIDEGLTRNKIDLTYEKTKNERKKTGESIISTRVLHTTKT